MNTTSHLSSFHCRWQTCCTFWRMETHQSAFLLCSIMAPQLRWKLRSTLYCILNLLKVSPIFKIRCFSSKLTIVPACQIAYMQHHSFFLIALFVQNLKSITSLLSWSTWWDSVLATSSGLPETLGTDWTGNSTPKCTREHLSLSPSLALRQMCAALPIACLIQLIEASLLCTFFGALCWPMVTTRSNPTQSIFKSLVKPSKSVLSKRCSALHLLFQRL